jgi:hypothetical protein
VAKSTRRGANEPPTETLAGGGGGLLFLLVGVNHGGELGLRLSIIGLGITTIAAVAFFIRLILWLKHREPPVPPAR